LTLKKRTFRRRNGRSGLKRSIGDWKSYGKARSKESPARKSSRVPARSSPRRYEFHPAAHEEFFPALRFYRETESSKVASFESELRRCLTLLLRTEKEN
jgi:hypothetical protein